MRQFDDVLEFRGKAGKAPFTSPSLKSWVGTGERTEGQRSVH